MRAAIFAHSSTHQISADEDHALREAQTAERRKKSAERKSTAMDTDLSHALNGDTDVLMASGSVTSAASSTAAAASLPTVVPTTKARAKKYKATSVGAFTVPDFSAVLAEQMADAAAPPAVVKPKKPKTPKLPAAAAVAVSASDVKTKKPAKPKKAAAVPAKSAQLVKSASPPASQNSDDAVADDKVKRAAKRAADDKPVKLPSAKRVVHVGVGSDKGDAESSNFYADLNKLFLANRSAFRTPDFAAILFVQGNKMVLRPLARPGSISVSLE